MTTNSTYQPVHIVGGGLAGSEAAWQIAQSGVPVILHEMRKDDATGKVITDAHQTDGLAEMVCSNSFRSDDWQFNAVGLLHAEMRKLDSLILSCADQHQVPAGGALAVDRDNFSAEAEAILALSGEGQLSFFDAIAPIIHFESINMDVAWRQSRYDKEGPGGDATAYINLPMNKEQYEAFIDALIDGPKTEFKEWENVPYFDGCLPIEVMAERGRETLRHGPMKPVGLTNPRDPTVKSYAIVQLRQDNALATLWNMVGFQTKLKHGVQAETFRMIPGLENAQFARLGGLHRNTFINSPKLLDRSLRMKAQPRLRFAGQVTGVEGYVESAAMGLLTGRFAAADRKGAPIDAPPPTTALGALVEHITGGHLEAGNGPGSFQPMNINYGLLPPLEAPKVDEDGKKIPLKERGRAKKRLMSLRALKDLEAWAGA
jgi:methylenetetrahydrofolate--tRNA-(uracil-5-)-methyltransferase